MQAIFWGQHFCGDWGKKSILIAILANIHQRNCSNKFKITEIENKFDYIFLKSGSNQVFVWKDLCTFNLNVEMILNLIPRH